MTSRRHAVLLAAFCTLPACYHATIETSATPSTTTIEKSFASSWIYGLVPPSTVETAAKCTSGVAKVETQISFLNGLVNVLTLGIYSPMSLKVTCAEAAKTSSIDSPAGPTPIAASQETLPETLAAAALMSRRSGHPELVRIVQ